MKLIGSLIVSQEPASSLFSLLNLITTLIGFKYLYADRIKRSLSCQEKRNGNCDRTERTRGKEEEGILELSFQEPFFVMTAISAVLGSNAW